MSTEAGETGVNRVLTGPWRLLLAEVCPALPDGRGAAWLAAMRRALAAQLDGDLPEWPEVAGAGRSDDLPPGAYDALLALAAEVDLGPAEVYDEIDERIAAARRAGRESIFPHLLREATWWLPYRGPFVFRTLDPTGARRTFGSHYQLYKELLHLNNLAWEATAAEVASWRDPAGGATPAQRAYSALAAAVNAAIMENHLVLVTAE